MLTSHGYYRYNRFSTYPGIECLPDLCAFEIDYFVKFVHQKAGQGDLAKKMGASREIIGKYERNENLPSIEMVSRMAKAFGVTVDYLIGEAENASLDKETVQRIYDIQKMDPDTKKILFNVIDTYIQNFKTKQAFNK